ncbi:guanylate kinase [Hydrogenibacillus schlegelii]|uniref:Guanylate kinase n=1 Tax=Hydrogenibacillus schlegelii TaxID=1484 RepID=A0A2T5G9W3_HYDSH|nr:guanylate kinase [Hydrogenibacillus schlegelii]PTQ52948.1 MAG: Guanylate kinase [Hydrogenibacillus schlegelii]
MEAKTVSEDALLSGRRGLLIVLSGPSGVGKGTVGQKLRERMPDLVYSVSVTSRPPRAGEVEGVNYFFRSREQFEEMIRQDAFLEWAEYVSNYYGTPKAFVFEKLAQGRDVLLEIEVQGARQVRRRYPDGVFIFLAPPTWEALVDRIQGRGTEDPAVISERLRQAEQEVREVDLYDYVVVNDDVDAAVERIRCIITAEHLRRARAFDEMRRRLTREVWR